AGEVGELHPDTLARLRRINVGSFLAVPFLRGDEAIGTLFVLRNEIRPFTEQQIALLETFADQAVIAIENARLFSELQESLERQPATAEVLRVIASSPTDLQPVLEAIMDSGMRLTGSANAALLLREGDQLACIASVGSSHHGQYPVGEARSLASRSSTVRT